MTIAAHQTLYEDSIAFGTRETLMAEEGKADMEQRISELEEDNEELKRQLREQRTIYEITEKKAIESQQLEEKRHNEDIMALERSIQQLQDQMTEITNREGIISSNKKDTSEHQLHSCFVTVSMYIFDINF
uniref:Axonemal dynein light intermediate polypeptide 1 n=1 Tax=Tetraodon nigroviridis TaxID=99883 RepID=H3CZP6_TETNG